MAKKTKPSSVEAMLMDPDTPFEHRRQILQHLCADEGKTAQSALVSLLDSAAQSNGEMIWDKKIKEVESLKQQMLEGALRPATFVRLVSGNSPDPSERTRRGAKKANGRAKPPTEKKEKAEGKEEAESKEKADADGVAHLFQRAHVLTEEGTALYPLPPNQELAQQLRCGDEVLLDGQGKMILFATGGYPEVGEEARLERRIGRDRVEVSLRDFEKMIYRAADRLVEQFESEEAKPGDMLLVCSRRSMAFDAIPRDDKLSHYRYLCKQAAPKVDVKRDIGAPPKFIKELEDHVRMEMTEPELGAKYRLMRCRTKLLTGVSGSGKTLSIQGLWRSIYGVMSDVTGVPIEDLPFRVLRLRAGSVLSKWYSESEKQLDKFFDEVEQLADEYFELPNGQMVLLPVIVICEEIDGLARTRGSDSVSDRVQTTLLQRLDATSQRMRDQLILYLFTSNVPELIDPAFLRRAGGTIERFDRLNRRACSEVLDKHLRDLPLREDDATRLNGAALRRVKGAILPWLYSANGEDRGLVEITYVGATEPEVKYRRDFLTGALIARAIQEASEQGRAAEWSGRAPGVTTSYLTSAIASQVGSIVDQLHQHNVNQYVSLPEGARVASVRRISQPKRLPPQLMRNP